MSFVAYSEKEHIHKIQAKDVPPSEQKNIFYCQNPECNCKFTLSSYHSSKIRTHFVKLKSSKHIVGCWYDQTISESGDKEDYDTSDFSPASLLYQVQKVKDTGAAIGTTKAPGLVTALDEKTKQTPHIHTIRQLYAVCIMNDDDEKINGIKIKDIFAGRKTSYFYTKYISGVKLVECSYHSYDATKNTINLQFPYAGGNFRISAHFASPDLYGKMNRELYKYEKPILIYAVWSNNQTEIVSKHQIVPIK